MLINRFLKLNRINLIHIRKKNRIKKKERFTKKLKKFTFFLLSESINHFTYPQNNLSFSHFPIYNYSS